MNGLHKERHHNNLSSPRVGGPGDGLSSPNSKTTRVRWTVKNITRKEEGKNLSKLSSWLTSQKLDDKNSAAKSPSGGGAGHHHPQMTSGFDLAKLYPELSSKLGLIKSSANDVAGKSSLGSKTVQSSKSVSANSRNNSVITNSEFHEPTGKTSNSNYKAINSNVYKSHYQHDKVGGTSVSTTKTRTVSLNNDVKKNKQRETLHLTKLSEDKLRKLISYQALNNKVSLNSPLVSKCESKTKAPARSKVSTVSLFDAVCDKTFPCSFVYPLMSGGSLKPNKISLFPRHSPSPLPNVEALSPQLRVHKLYQDHYAYKSNLFPLGK